MRFYLPTNVYIEKECVKNHKEELASLGKKAIIITGKHSAAANGSLADVTSVLEEYSVPYVIFNDVEENPSVETVAKAAALGVQEKVDFVIGIGGGSPLDTAKGVAVMAGNPEETMDCLYTPKKLVPLPFAAVPTTCGTGSEVTPNAVYTRHALKKKGSMSHHVNAKLALVDGKYLASASKKLIINTAVDALAHSIESRLHVKSNRYNHMLSEYAIKIWAGLIPYLKGEVEATPDIYEDLMMSSTIAGMAIAQTATSLPHAISYPMTLNYNMHHGRACGIFQAAYMEEYAANKPDDVKVILDLLGFEDTESFGRFIKDLLGPEYISEEGLEEIADIVSNDTGKLKTFPFSIDREGIRRILKKSLVVS